MIKYGVYSFCSRDCPPFNNTINSCFDTVTHRHIPWFLFVLLSNHTMHIVYLTQTPNYALPIMFNEDRHKWCACIRTSSHSTQPLCSLTSHLTLKINLVRPKLCCFFASFNQTGEQLLSNTRKLITFECLQHKQARHCKLVRISLFIDSKSQQKKIR